MQNSEYLQRIGHGKRYDCCFLTFFFWQKMQTNNEAEAVALAMEHQQRGPSDSFCTKVS